MADTRAHWACMTQEVESMAGVYDRKSSSRTLGSGNTSQVPTLTVPLEEQEAAVVTKNPETQIEGPRTEGRTCCLSATFRTSLPTGIELSNTNLHTALTYDLYSGDKPPKAMLRIQSKDLEVRVLALGVAEPVCHKGKRTCDSGIHSACTCSLSDRLR